MSNKKKAGSVKGLELAVIYIFMMLFLVIADQLVKRYIVFSMDYKSSVPVIDNFFSLYYVRNTGSAFSFLADKEWGITVLSAISAVLGLLVIVLMFIACHKYLRLLGFAFSLIAAGAFGNLIDRIQLKYVIDYLRFDFGDYTFPIFNLADICAVVGTFILMGIIIFGHKYFDSFWGSRDKKETKEKKDKMMARQANVKMPVMDESEEDEIEDMEETDEDDLEVEAAGETEELSFKTDTLSIPDKTGSDGLINSDGED